MTTEPLPTRIPGVPSLTTKLPKGTEGGKEFARLLSLLLHHQAGSNGGLHFAIDDASGDYAGLDSTGRLGTQGSEVGYQYKFFPSPLSDKHRSEVEASLQTAIARHDQSKISRWILVTPDDLTETSRRRSGGDVSWFESLRRKYDAPFEIEHFGHTKIVHLFLQCDAISLRYYPELATNGLQRRSRIDQLRATYDANLTDAHGRIEFVGMSVYKEEATRGVPLEEIYIPLSAVSEGVTNVDEHTPRVSPSDFLAPGSTTVILGDPGSGKSTLLSCLALAGLSLPLQRRTGALPDDRLSIFVTLRRYADEIKTRRNLSISDYIVEACRADFSIPDLDWEFFSSFLKSGRAKIFFDGLDELPTPQYKRLIRDRIKAFITSNPGNTTIVTSRIVGYDGASRFPEVRFKHFKLAQLRLVEIEAFIRDWYRIRVESEADRRVNIADLLRIVNHPENVAIRELARNPLLLTIVTLVHRIDAVLPDQRVVLYRKCTETLLDTWYKWKYRADEEVNKGRIERRNRQRIEAIAHWMHVRATTTNGRAVVPASELQAFLADYIARKEPSTTQEQSPEDASEEFLRFVRERTGLLIEVGDSQYSFVHLTFQEYLTATFLATDGETGGVASIWEKIEPLAFDARWQEVIRLLVASFRSNESQAFFVEELLTLRSASDSELSILTLAGLMLDGIEPAEERADLIIEIMLETALFTGSRTSLQSIARMTRLWISKASENEQRLRTFLVQYAHRDPQAIARTLLTALVLGAPLLGDDTPLDQNYEHALYDALFRGTPVNNSSIEPIRSGLDELEYIYDRMAITSSELNLLASGAQAFCIAIHGDGAFKSLFRRQMKSASRSFPGPFGDLIRNTQAIAIEGIDDDVLSKQSRVRRPSSRAIDGIFSIYYHLYQQLNMLGYARVNDREFSAIEEDKLRIPLEERAHRRNARERSRAWRGAASNDDFIAEFASPITSCLALEPREHWSAAIADSFIPKVPELLAEVLTDKNISRHTDILKGDPNHDTSSYFAAWLILLDAAACDFNSMPERSSTLLDLATDSRHPALALAKYIFQCATSPDMRMQHDAQLFEGDMTHLLIELEQCSWIYAPQERMPIERQMRPSDAKRPPRAS